MISHASCSGKKNGGAYEVPESQARRKLSEKPEGMTSLIETERNLEKTLTKFPETPDNEPLLIVAIDEVSNLLHSKTGGETTSLYVALGRIISCLKEFRIWWFFLSTESKVDRLIPSDTFDYENENFVDKPSSREVLQTSNTDHHGPRQQVLKIIPPFFGFQLHIEIKRRMFHEKSVELQTSIAEFVSPQHMALFGRPLWSVYTQEPEHMDNLAMSKIIGGATEFNPENRHHVFAVISAGLSLDVCLQNPVSLPLSAMPVNSSLRIITGIDQDFGVLETISPPEPVVAKAAFQHRGGAPFVR